MKVKICGLKDQSSVEGAVKAGADFLGFVFADSPRKVSPVTVKKITKNVPDYVKKVGVFVSPKFEDVEEIIQQAQLDIVQIHGEVSTTTFSVPFIQAMSVTPGFDWKLIENQQADYLLLDAPPQKYVGGNGQLFDWTQIPQRIQVATKVIIAGGLTIENVLEAKNYFQPYCVDVSSGVETNGQKDLIKIQQFIQKAKEEDKCINNQ